MFSQIFSGLVPAVNYAEILSQQNASIEELETILSEGIVLNAIMRDSALAEFGFIMTPEGNLSPIPTPVILSDVSSIRYISPSSKFNTVDTSDSNDYQNRYTSLDAKIYAQDGTDIAFFRIVNAKDKTKQVFPISVLQPQPGITETKFKQFILTQLSMQHSERMQIVETNKEDYQVLFFGKKPEVVQIAGYLKNTVENPWSVNMLFLWDDFMRGTKLAENGWICQLYADGEFYEGYPFNFSRSKMAGNDILVNFNFNFLIKTRSVIRTGTE